MTKATDIGTNKTGIAAAPVQGPQAVEGAREGAPADALGDGVAIAKAREAYAAQSGPVGTVPPPLTLTGMAKTALSALSGEKASVLVDKLGERLAFERTGTRLYEAALSKARVAAAAQDGMEPTVAQLVEICEDEQRHFDMLRAAFERLGADPTAQTPSADVAGVASSGLVQVATDPRTSLTETLEALLVAELADNDGWALLVDLVEGLGYDDLATRFGEAQRAETRHLERVRRWLSERTLAEAGA